MDISVTSLLQVVSNKQYGFYNQKGEEEEETEQQPIEGTIRKTEPRSMILIGSQLFLKYHPFIHRHVMIMEVRKNKAHWTMKRKVLLQGPASFLQHFTSLHSFQELTWHQRRTN